MILFGCQKALSQEIKVAGRFQADSLRIGDVITYSLTAKYPSDLNILFPDSTFDFFPFEYQSKKYYSTKTRDGLSYDSAVYYVSTFEIDSIQSLSLPVYVIHPADCTTVEPDPVSVRLLSLVGTMPDSVEIKDLPLKITVAYEPVSGNFNYIIASAVFIGLVLILVVTWLVYGKRIRRYFKLKKLKRNHALFLSDYTVSVNRVNEEQSALAAEHSVSIWKKYMEGLEKRPYTKMTTRETLDLIHNDFLKQNLQTIDRVIYGNMTASAQPFEELRSFADQQFQQKVREVQHG